MHSVWRLFRNISITSVLLVLVVTAHGQNLIGAVHSFSWPINGIGTGLLGYEQGLCLGALTHDSIFETDISWPLNNLYYGHYKATWVNGLAETDNVLSDGSHVMSFSGELVGTWTPYTKNRKGKWTLSSKRSVNGVPGWFQMPRIAAATEAPSQLILGCGGLQVIFGVLN
jgi:hypothetical protein